VIKLVFCLRRLPHLTLEEFQDYWLNTHGPLVRSHASALKIQRYVQSHTLRNPGLDQSLAASRGAPEGFDGVAELWWNSIEDLLSATATDEGREAGRILLEDERKFIDDSRSPLWVSDEQEVIGSQP
jgi:uncharacterized protein (TIGR02118 family)